MSLTIHFIDVGQGDATLLQYDAPDGIPRNILVDGGRGSTAQTLATYLQRQGVTRLHLVVATHIDDDHIAGLIDILAQFPTARFWGPDPAKQEPLRPLVARTSALAATVNATTGHDDAVTIESVNTYDRLHMMAVSSRAVIEYPLMGHDASNLFPGLELRVMGPPPELAQVAELMALDAVPAEEQVSILSTATNNSSIVLRAGVNGQHVLLTGDAERASWRAMIRQWGQGLHARVLKVSHHGSSNGTTREVVAAVDPREAAISVGPNSYGHPTPAVLELLQPPITLHRTDQQGNIVIRLTDRDELPPSPPPARSWWQQLLDWLFGRTR